MPSLLLFLQHVGLALRLRLPPCRLDPIEAAPHVRAAMAASTDK